MAPSAASLRFRRAAILLMAACALLVLPADPAWAESPVSKEYQVKAAFLFNFVQFVEWPSDAFASADAPIRLGVLGDDPFGQALEEIVQGETVHNRRLVIMRAQRLDDLRSCHLLFISRSERAGLDGILAGLGREPVLTIGDIAGFAKRGGAINLYLDGNKVRFEINQLAARERNLRLSPQLLKLGRMVDPDGDGGRK